MINFQKGNLFNHLEEKVVIVHITNQRGNWGGGFTKYLSEKWPTNLGDRSPEFVYKWKIPKLGECQWIEPEKDIIVVNMCAQDNITNGLTRRCHYGYLSVCMNEVNKFIPIGWKILSPFLGTGIGGADKDIIKELLTIWQDLDVTIFEL